MRRPMKDDDLLRVIDAASQWLDIDGVVAVAPGERGGRRSIVVGVSRPVSEMAGRGPSTFRGYPLGLEGWGGISPPRGKEGAPVPTPSGGPSRCHGPPRVSHARPP